MSDLNKPELYNRISCRSPLRKTNHIQPKKEIISQPVFIKQDVKQTVKEEEVKLLNNRTSCRSIKRQVKSEVHDCTYKVVTKTPAGRPVNIPTSHSFIKFKTSVQPLYRSPTIIHYIDIDKKMKYPFVEALDLFENNQSYILEQLEKGEQVDHVLILLKTLNAWFNKIKEPKPSDFSDIKEWKEREKFKKINHYSSYLDKDLIPYL